jgi:hypothetical protein
MSHWNFVYGFTLKIFWWVSYWVTISPHDQTFSQISTCTSALISSVSLNMFLQAKSFNNRTFSEDVVYILCSLYFFHVPHSLRDNKMKGEKCATNFAQCLCFLTYFLPCVTFWQLSPNILFTSLLKYLQSVKGYKLKYNLNIKHSLL